MINVGLLAFVGYGPSLAPDRVQVTTGSGVEYAPRVPFQRSQDARLPAPECRG